MYTIFVLFNLFISPLFHCFCYSVQTQL